MDKYKIADISDIAPRVEIIRIGWIGPSMNTIWAGIHWSKRKKSKDAGLKACHVAMRNIMPFDCPVKLEFNYIVGKGKRMYDVSNYALTGKVIEDSLVKFSILEDDTPEHVVRITMNKPTRGPKSITIVKITEVESKPIID